MSAVQLQQQRWCNIFSENLGRDFNFKNRDLSGTDVAEIMPQFKKEKEKIYI